MARKIEEIAWAAGLFEGEGSCFVGRTHQRQPVVSLVMTDEDVVRRFAAIIGCGYVNTYRRPPNKRYWRWDARGRDDVLRVLSEFRPFLGFRRQEAATRVVERATQMRSRSGPRTHCKHGHELTGANVYVHKKTGKRQCRACRAACSAAQRREGRRVLRPAA